MPICRKINFNQIAPLSLHSLITPSNPTLIPLTNYDRTYPTLFHPFQYTTLSLSSLSLSSYSSHFSRSTLSPHSLSRTIRGTIIALLSHFRPHSFNQFPPSRPTLALDFIAPLTLNSPPFDQPLLFCPTYSTYSANSLPSLSYPTLPPSL